MHQLKTQTQPNSFFRLALSVGLVSLILNGAASSTFGQRNDLPNVTYFQPFNDFYQGEYRRAVKDWASASNSAYKFGNQRFLDSICYWTMAGECHYHLGNYADAIANYEQALSLYLSYPATVWQSRVQMPPTISVDNAIAQRVRITWGTSNRNSKIPQLPDSFSTMFGRLDAERAWQEGGVLQNPEFRSVNINEIVRCTALALHRRRVIKGNTCKFDPFSAKLVNGLRGGAIADGTLLGAYNGVLLGIAQASNDEWESAAKTLNRSLQFNGGMDHPLTPVALLELANIGVETNHPEVGERLAIEASISAAMFGQPDLIEEALSLGAQIHMLTNDTPYAPLEPAIVWATRERLRLMQASLGVRLAESLAEANQPDLAATALQQLKSIVSNRNDLGNTIVGARFNYVNALIQFEKGKFTDGMRELSATLAGYQNLSLWLYRLSLADGLAIAGNVTERQADLLYEALLRDPNARDWQLDPLEAMAFLASNHVGPMERWFDIVVNRKDMDRAVNVAELVRRHRFFSQLPLGGRLMAFRWVMHAPELALTPKALQQRKKFLAANTQYQQWIDRSEQIRTALLLLPLNPEQGSEEEKKQAKLILELTEVSAIQEAFLASFALRREPVEMIFPPQFEISDFRKNMAKDQLALVSLATRSGYHLFSVNSVSVQYIGLRRERDVLRGVSELLKRIGVSEPTVDLTTLQSDKWKETAAEFTTTLLGEIPVAAWADIRELVIVPDGMLWYLPFELLQIGEDEDAKNFCDQVELRYSPTLYLSYQIQRPLRPLSRTAVATGKIHTRGESDLTASAFQELVAELPTAVKFAQPVRLPSNPLGSLFDQLVVLSEISIPRKSTPLLIQPMQLETSALGSTLGAWMTLPWYGPEHMVLPGFHSDGGTGMRGKYNGNDLFLTTTAMLGAGSRTILISRWRPGGINSLELSRNYAQRLPDMPGALALKESVAVARELDLKYDAEPQLKMRARDPVLKAEHPFFWAGLMRMEIPAEGAIVDQPKIKAPPMDGLPDNKPVLDQPKPDEPRQAGGDDEKPDPAEKPADKKKIGDGDAEKDG